MIIVICFIVFVAVYVALIAALMIVVPAMYSIVNIALVAIAVHFCVTVLVRSRQARPEVSHAPASYRRGLVALFAGVCLAVFGLAYYFMPPQLHAASQTQIDHSINTVTWKCGRAAGERFAGDLSLLYATTVCTCDCQRPDECASFGARFNRMSADYIADAADRARPAARQWLDELVNDLKDPLRQLNIRSPRYTVTDESIPLVTFDFHNDWKLAVKSIYYSVTVKSPDSPAVFTREGSFTFPTPVEPGARSTVAMQVDSNRWSNDGRQRPVVPRPRDYSIEVVPLSVETDRGDLDLRPLRRELERWEENLECVRRRQPMSSWQHLMHGEILTEKRNPELFLFTHYWRDQKRLIHRPDQRTEERRFFAAEPDFKTIRAGTQGKLDTGMVLSGRLSNVVRLPKEFDVILQTGRSHHVKGSEYDPATGEFCLHIYPHRSEFHRRIHNCSLLITANRFQERLITVPVNAHATTQVLIDAHPSLECTLIELQRERHLGSTIALKIQNITDEIVRIRRIGLFGIADPGNRRREVDETHFVQRGVAKVDTGDVRPTTIFGLANHARRDGFCLQFSECPVRLDAGSLRNMRYTIADIELQESGSAWDQIRADGKIREPLRDPTAQQLLSSVWNGEQTTNEIGSVPGWRYYAPKESWGQTSSYHPPDWRAWIIFFELDTREVVAKRIYHSRRNVIAFDYDREVLQLLNRFGLERSQAKKVLDEANRYQGRQGR